MWYPGFLSKAMCGLAAIGLVGAPGVPAADARSMPRPPVVKPVHPVNCSIFSRNDYDRSSNQQSRTGVMRASPSMALPPPPPPGVQIVTTGKTITGGSVAAESRIAPYPYPRPQPLPLDRERYDGKDVASIKRVADDPVSTFAVDVDTGSYSNVRRFLNEGRVCRRKRRCGPRK